MEGPGPRDQSPVVLDFTQLNDPSADLSREIEDAFGRSGLGLITVKNVPNFPRLRRELLPLAAQFAALPATAKARCEDPASSFNVGWSCGVERLEDGTPDTLKGSYYANPLCDAPTSDPDLLARFPSYTRPNLWPSGDLPALEGAFKALGKLMYEVGLLLSRHCDKYVAERRVVAGDHTLHAAISRSPSNKVRDYLNTVEAEC